MWTLVLNYFHINHLPNSNSKICFSIIEKKSGTLKRFHYCRKTYPKKSGNPRRGFINSCKVHVHTLINDGCWILDSTFWLYLPVLDFVFKIYLFSFVKPVRWPDGSLTQAVLTGLSGHLRWCLRRFAIQTGRPSGRLRL